MTKTTNIAARAGRWSVHHKRTAIIAWLAFVAAAIAIGAAVGTRSPEREDGVGESGRAQETLAQAFPEGEDETVLVQARRPEQETGDRAFEAAVGAVVDAVSRQPGVRAIRGPYGNPEQISRDGRAALVRFEIAGDESEAKERVERVLQAVETVQERHPDLRIEQVGEASAARALTEQHDEDMHKAETISLPLTLAILVVAFGALVAAGVPLLLAGTAVATAIGLVAPLSLLVPMEESIGSAIFLIGLAVGVDYSMFYLRRAREERAAGHASTAAVEAAAATSGRAVLVSGLTVAIALAGMFLAGAPLFASFAIGMILAVATAVLGSLTFLPALLAALGDRVEKGRVPVIGRRKREGRQSRAWAWVLERVLRRPLASALASAALLLALAAPTLGLHTAETGLADSLPPALEITATYKRIEAAFPGRPQSAVVVIEADEVTAPTVDSAIDELRRQAVASGGFTSAGSVEISRDHTVARVDLPIASNGTDQRSNAALATLRRELIPATVEREGQARADVTGTTAGTSDFNQALKSHVAYVFAFVLGTAFLLLLVSFRSLVVPIKVILLNLLSVGAAYGLLKLVFQDGRLEGLLDYDSRGFVVSWLPLLLFVLLFGISMDYHVFILSRIREAADRGMPTEEAVTHGIKTTAGVVTAAAVIMVAVFGVFVTQTTIEAKQMGVGLAAAILIDATVVRAVLLPATMKLLGDWNWYLPRWLEWLPRLSPEPSRTRSAETEPARA
jgi:uncharacterized membrane protein YdfJ with MMPL/SSD domain